MKYQALKHLKTKTVILGICDSLAEAYARIESQAIVSFKEFSYMGGFPLFEDEKQRIYSIQGYNETHHVVCSLPKEELLAFNFN